MVTLAAIGPVGFDTTFAARHQVLFLLVTSSCEDVNWLVGWYTYIFRLELLCQRPAFKPSSNKTGTTTHTYMTNAAIYRHLRNLDLSLKGREIVSRWGCEKYPIQVSSDKHWLDPNSLVLSHLNLPCRKGLVVANKTSENPVHWVI